MFISCECSDTFEDLHADRPDCYEETLRKAKKEHKCCECDRQILKGERYEVATGKWDGHWTTYKTCLGCSRIRKHFAPFGSYFGGLAEQVADCIGYNYVTGTGTFYEDD